MSHFSVEFYEIAIAGLIGMVLQMLMKAKSIQDKARLANVEFKFFEYFTQDWVSHLISTVAVMLFLVLVRRRVQDIPQNLYELVLGASATVGYSGADLVSRFFSATNRKVNMAIDHKTNISDTATGTMGNPTPK
jgi:hypothetical protein